MKKGIVIISACFFLFSCVSKTKYSEALSTIDSLKCTSDKQYSEAINTINSLRAENTRLTKEVDDLLNGEERLITFYQELCSKKAYIQAEEMYNKIVSKYPESQSNKRLSNIAIIKKKAIADGTFMKAPNGESTNLTETQWLQVRTKNFINWFGDSLDGSLARVRNSQRKTYGNSSPFAA